MSRAKSPRMRRVNEQLREIIAERVVHLKDPRIGFVTIISVECAPDLRHAVVFYSVLGSEGEAQETAEALRSAARKIQAAIANEVRLKYTPVLEFRIDPSVEYGARISRILHDLQESEKEKTE